MSERFDVETLTINPNGYPDGWLALYGSLAGDATFVAPARSSTHPVEDFDGE